MGTNDTLEALIDRHTVAGVLRAIRDICDEKAAHIRENWQDEVTALAWDRAAIQTGNTAERIKV